MTGPQTVPRPSARVSTAKGHLLVYEDCGELRCLTAALQERGFEVYRGDSYAEVLHQLESSFSDFVVPGRRAVSRKARAGTGH